MLYKGEIPFVRMIVPLITGISGGFYYSNEALSGFAIFFAFILLLMLTFMISVYRKYSIYRWRWLTGFLVHGFILSTGYWLTVNTSELFDKAHYRFFRGDLLLAEIESDPIVSGSIYRFEARIKGTFFEGKKSKAKGRIIVSVHNDSAKTSIHKYGDLLLIPANYDSINPPYNPGEFDYQSYLSDRQIYFQAFLTSDQIYLLDRHRGNPIISFALQLRKQLIQKFRHYLPDESAAAFASTLVLGYRAELSKELIDAYAKTGTMHVLSVSGMHVGIVFMVLNLILKFMDKTSNTRLIRAILIITVIWFYALLTGFSAPACRAAVMLSFIVLGKALNKRQNTYNLIAISAFLLLLYNPYYLLDAGFQLSYLAVTGIVFFHSRIYQTITIKNKMLDYMWSYSALSIAAQLATLPISIYYFHQFPVYFLFSNLFIVIPVSLIMYAGILFMFIPFPEMLHYGGIVLNKLINFTNSILYYIENLPFSTLDGIWLTAFECTLIFIVILSISFRLTEGRKILMFPIGIFILILSLSLIVNWKRKYDLHHLIFYNLRKHSAIAYLTKGQSVIVSDVENSDKLVSFSILPAVKSKGSRTELFFAGNTKFSGETFFGERNFYQFAGYRIFKWDKEFDDVIFTGTLNVSAVLISGSPKVSLEDIKSCLDFKIIIIDANNPDYKIKRWVIDAKKRKLPYYVLKKNPALIVNL